MADDLDAFFDEVSEAEQDAVQDKDNDNDNGNGNDTVVHEPPSKKAKTQATAPPDRPRSIVVASATPVAVVAASAGATTTTTTNNNKAPTAASAVSSSIGPAAPPPTYGYNGATHRSVAAGGAGGGGGPTVSSYSLPPYPTTNNPPLPPPLPPGPPPPAVLYKQAPVRVAAGKVWVDETLADWPDNDFRLFVGNIPPEVSDEQLFQHFEKYPSLHRSRIVCDKKGESKGYGFVSLLAPLECAKALREMDQSWLGSRPIKVKRSSWKDRDMKQVRKQQHKSNKQKKRMGLL
jgi:hypothetical protein